MSKAVYAPLLQNKEAFFSKNKDLSPEALRDLVRRKNNRKNELSFVYQNRNQLEHEFSHLFAALLEELKEELKQPKANRNPNARKQFWLYCYYCGTMLSYFHEIYGRNAQRDAYEEKLKQIKQILQAEARAEEELKTAESIGSQMLSDLGNFLSTPAHSAKIRDWIGFLNLVRLQIVFSKALVKTSIGYAIESLGINQFFVGGNPHDAEAMRQLLNKPTAIFNALSVGIFVARLIIDVGMIIKHIAFPQGVEKEIALLDRTKMVLKERYPRMLNDVVWASINGYTNYNSYFGLSSAAAGYISAGFLFFDVMLLVHRKQMADKDFLLKKTQYEGERAAFGDRPGVATKRLLLDKQIRQLEIDQEKTQAAFNFSIAGASMLCGGFTAAILVANPILVPTAFFITVLGTAMYATADKYARYEIAASIRNRARLDGKILSPEILAEYGAASSDFYSSYFKNALMPTLLLTACTISVPVALYATLAYLSYECLKGYAKFEQAQAIPPQQKNIAAQPVKTVGHAFHKRRPSHVDTGANPAHHETAADSPNSIPATGRTVTKSS